MMHSQDQRPEVPHHLPQPSAGPLPLEGALLPAEHAPFDMGGDGLRGLPPALSAKPTLLSLLKSLQSRWLLATTLGLLAAAVASVAVWYLVPISYTARSLLLISQKQPGMGLNDDKNTQREDFGVYQKTQSALVRQRFVLTAALRNPKVADLSMLKRYPDPTEWLETAIQVDFSLSPELMRVSLSGDKPQELVILLNALIDAYLDEVNGSEQRERLDRIQRLKDISSKYEEQLRARRRTYKDLAQAAGGTNSLGVMVRQQFEQEKLAAKQKDLIEIQRERLNLQMQVLALGAREKGNVAPQVPESAIEEALQKDGTLLSYQQRLNQMEMELEQRASAFKAGKEAPQLEKYKTAMKELQTAMAVHTTKRRTELTKAFSESKVLRTKEALFRDQEKIVMLGELEKILLEEVRKLTDKIDTSIKSSVDVESTRDEVEKVEGISRQLRLLIENYNVDISAASRIRLQDKADVRQYQAEKRQILLASGAGAAVLGLILVLIAYWEFHARRINTGEDVVMGLGWRLVGALPALPDRKRRRLMGNNNDKYWHSLLTESVDATRTMLLHAARTEGLKTVMVTSAVAGEGKTSLSCHLATSLARAGRKTLLIDCDLRSPAAHQLFEIPVSPGFSELLRGTVDLGDVIRSTPADNLWILPAGQCDAQTLQALTQDGVPTILHRLKEQFDFIVIDSSPVLPVADALVIGQYVDVLIFSLLRGVSRIPNVYSAYQRLRTLGIRMLGAVVNGVQSEVYGYSYHYGDRYGARPN